MKPGRDYVGVGVGALIFDDRGRLLLVRRGPKSKNEVGLWQKPGGTVEFGETLEEALKREVHEEVGLKVEVKRLSHVCDHLLPDEGQHWVSPAYVCEVVEGHMAVKEPEKIDKAGWFSLSEAEELPLSVVTKQDLVVLRAAEKGEPAND